MRVRTLGSSCLVALCGLVLAGPAAAQCEPDGDTRFVCGPISPEDLAVVPETPWVVVASWEDDGYLSAANHRDTSTVRLFPTATAQERHDPALYADCPGMVTDGFRAHGKPEHVPHVHAQFRRQLGFHRHPPGLPVVDPAARHDPVVLR